jgi:hypothetical protein
MSRRIRTVTMQAAGTEPPDRFFDRIIKYIPADVVGGWVAASGIISSLQAGSSRTTVLWIAFAVGLALAAGWTHAQTRESGKPPAWAQIVIASIAFAVWAFALGGPFAAFGWYNQAYGSLALIGFTLAAGLVVPRT